MLDACGELRSGILIAIDSWPYRTSMLPCITRCWSSFRLVDKERRLDRSVRTDWPHFLEALCVCSPNVHARVAMKDEHFVWSVNLASRSVQVGSQDLQSLRRWTPFSTETSWVHSTLAPAAASLHRYARNFFFQCLQNL